MSIQNDLIRAIIQKKIQEEMQTRQLQNSGNPLDRINGISSKVGNFGEGLAETGKFLNNYGALDKIGSGMQTVGNALQTGANAVQNVIPSVSTGIGATTGGSAASGLAAGPIGALVTLGAMGLTGTNRKRANASGEQTQQLADSQIDIAKNRLNQTSQIAEQLGNQSIMQSNLQPQVNNNSIQYGADTKDLIDSYIQSSLPEQTPISDTVNNYLQNQQQQPVESQMQPQNQLSDGIFNKLADGLGDFVAGYKDNRENGFAPDNLRPEENKGFMQRVGEGIGTASRMIQNPTLQGLIAGGISTALTGNPLYGVGMAYKFANNKMNSDLYKNILAQQGINVGNANGTLSSDDLSKILISKRYQKDFISRKDYDRMRLENGQLSLEDYNANLLNPDYNPEEMVNINGINSVAKAGRYDQQNKNDKSKNYYRSKNDGKNVIKVEYGEKPDSHSYTHVTYGAKPEQKSTTHVTYGERPSGKTESRVKVKSPDGKIGSIPASQLPEAIKKGYKKL